MPLTPAELVNIALARVGHRTFIGSLDEATTEAQVATVVYAHARDVVLSSFPWPWATARATLAVVADATRSGWTYVYALPADFVAARHLYNEANIGALETVASRTPYAIEGEAGSRVLLTDQEDAELVYTARVDTIANWPPMAQDALAWKLAAELAYALPVEPRTAVAMEQMYRRALADAMVAEGRQAQSAPLAESEFIRARS